MLSFFLAPLFRQENIYKYLFIMKGASNVFTSIDEIGEEKLSSKVQLATEPLIGISRNAFRPVLHSFAVLNNSQVVVGKHQL